MEEVQDRSNRGEFCYAGSRHFNDFMAGYFGINRLRYPGGFLYHGRNICDGPVFETGSGGSIFSF